MTGEQLNWVDPDVLANSDMLAKGEGLNIEYDFGREREFKEFFETGWLDPSFDNIRAVWDPLLTDENSRARLYAKTALWSVAQLRQLRDTQN